MNSSRLQDTRLVYRNLLHLCTLIIKYQKEKVKKIPFKTESKKNKISGIKLSKEMKDIF